MVAEDLVRDIDDHDLDVLEPDQDADRGPGLGVERDDSLRPSRRRLAQPPDVGFDDEPGPAQFAQHGRDRRLGVAGQRGKLGQATAAPSAQGAGDLTGGAMRLPVLQQVGEAMFFHGLGNVCRRRLTGGSKFEIE